MKKLLVGMLAFGSISIFAGDIENRKTGETISVEYYSDTNVVSISASLLNKTIKKDTSIYMYRNGTSDYSEMHDMSEERLEEVQAFESVRGLYKGVKENGMSGQAWAFGVPAVAAAVGIDILSLPITLPIEAFRKITHNSQFKKDKRLISEVLAESKVIKVSNTRFKRFMIYLGINNKH